jgi:hypothetical protein
MYTLSPAERWLHIEELEQIEFDLRRAVAALKVLHGAGDGPELPSDRLALAEELRTIGHEVEIAAATLRSIRTQLADHHLD